MSIKNNWTGTYERIGMDTFQRTGSKVTSVKVNASSNSIGSMYPVHPDLNDVPDH